MKTLNKLYTVYALREAARYSSSPESAGVVWEDNSFRPGSCLIEDIELSREFNSRLAEVLVLEIFIKEAVASRGFSIKEIKATTVIAFDWRDDEYVEAEFHILENGSLKEVTYA